MEDSTQTTYIHITTFKAKPMSRKEFEETMVNPELRWEVTNTPGFLVTWPNGNSEWRPDLPPHHLAT